MYVGGSNDMARDAEELLFVGWGYSGCCSVRGRRCGSSDVASAACYHGPRAATFGTPSSGSLDHLGPAPHHQDIRPH
jgi:hypothetical protein